MGKYKSAIRALADAYNYFDDGFLFNLRDALYISYLRNEERFYRIKIMRSDTLDMVLGVVSDLVGNYHNCDSNYYYHMAAEVIICFT